MKVELSEIKNCWQEMKITLPAEEAETEYRKIVNKYKSKINIPGFRKGKAPLSIMERTYADYFKDIFLQEAAEKLYKQALDTEDIHPVSEAELLEMEWAHNSDYTAKFKYEIMPEIEVKQYENFEVEFQPQVLQEVYVENMIDNMRKNMSIQEDGEGPVEKDNIVSATFSEISEQDKPFTFERTFVVDDNVYNAELNEKIKGRKTGEEFQSTIFDAETEDVAKADEKFRGKLFNIKVESIKVNILPEVNDEFAKDLEYESVEDLRNKIRAELQNRIDRDNQEEKRNAVMAKLVELNPFDVPASMIEHYAGELGKDAVEKYGITQKQAVDLYKPIAEYNIKSYHLHSRITELLDLTITDEDKQTAIAEAAANMKMSADDYSRLYAKQIEGEEFQEGLKERKTMDYLLEQAVYITPKPREEDEGSEEQEKEDI
ncbi:MAG: trigger factor [Candidatus Cloacimonetes bacterium]|nr:trigger factor [Candidatus Cloacimonadota bacterium]